MNSSERHFHVQYSVFSAFSMGISIQWMLYRNLFNAYIVLPSTLHCLYIINKFIEQKTRTLLSAHQKKNVKLSVKKHHLPEECLTMERQREVTGSFGISYPKLDFSWFTVDCRKEREFRKFEKWKKGIKISFE